MKTRIAVLLTPSGAITLLNAYARSDYAFSLAAVPSEDTGPHGLSLVVVQDCDEEPTRIHLNADGTWSATAAVMVDDGRKSGTTRD